MAGAGYRRDSFNYQAPTVSVSSVGQATTTWSTVTTIAGVVTPQQREVLDDLGVAIRTDVVIEASWHPSVNAGGRLVDLTTSKVYNITGVVDPDANRKKRLRITATAIDGSDGIP